MAKRKKTDRYEPFVQCLTYLEHEALCAKKPKLVRLFQDTLEEILRLREEATPKHAIKIPEVPDTVPQGKAFSRSSPAGGGGDSRSTRKAREAAIH